MGSRAQISAEFIILVGLAFILALAFPLASIQKVKDLNSQKESDMAKDLGLKLQKELVTASQVEDGYNRIFTLPMTLEGINYSVSSQNSTLIITAGSALYIVSSPYFVGNISKGTNNITKSAGVIYVR